MNQWLPWFSLAKIYARPRNHALLIPINDWRSQLGCCFKTIRASHAEVFAQHLLVSQIGASLVDHRWRGCFSLAEEDAAGEWLAVPYVPCLCGGTRNVPAMTAAKNMAHGKMRLCMLRSLCWL